MNSKNEKAEFPPGTLPNENLRTPQFRKIDSRIFEPNFDGSHIIIGVPRDFLYPRVLPPVGPQKPIDKFNSV